MAENESKLTPDQRAVYNEIIKSVRKQLGKIFFLEASGKTSKTFFINLIFHNASTTFKIAFAVDSSRIATTLLAGEETTHTTFKLPLNPYHQDQPVCNLKKRNLHGKTVAKICVNSFG